MLVSTPLVFKYLLKDSDQGNYLPWTIASLTLWTMILEIPNDFDILVGGFPCQGFSIANIKRSMEDERNFLYKEMLRVIKDKKPKYFVACTQTRWLFGDGGC